MKTYQLKITTGMLEKLQQLSGGDCGVFYFGLDIEVAGAAVTASFNGGPFLHIGKDTRAGILHALGSLCQQGHQVHCVQEACGFGYQFHNELLALGVQSLVVAPEILNGKRKTDKVDARALCAKLLDFIQRADHRAFKVVRVPSLEQERYRALWRQRMQLVKTLNMLNAHGRALLLQHGVLTIPERWWGQRLWPKVRSTLDPWLVTMLEPHRDIILQIKGRISELEKLCDLENQARQEEEQQPRGLGQATRRQLQAEIIDWNRFKNRRQVGSFIGCCPSENSSAGRRRQGAIDRMGNARIRSMLVEAVWRLVRWNPQWRGIQKFSHVLARGAKAGPAARKKAIIACTRLLAIDLWRIETRQISAADVGLILK